MCDMNIICLVTAGLDKTNKKLSDQQVEMYCDSNDMRRSKLSTLEVVYFIICTFFFF